MKKAQQQELPFAKPARVGSRVQAVVRCGRMPSIVTLHDIDKIIGPRGEGAQDAFDRDVSMMDRDDFDDGY